MAQDTALQVIELQQLPIIVERLHSVKADIERRTAEATSLICTEETYKSVKDARAQLTKEFKEYEAQRTAIKSKILEPYNAFEQVYRECVTAPFQQADAELKQKITDVTSGIVAQKTEALMDYYGELVEASDIDWLDDLTYRPKVNMSDSLTSLKKQAKAFVDGIVADVAAIEGMDNAAEIMVEYRSNLDLPNAIKTVGDRHKALEEQRRRGHVAELSDWGVSSLKIEGRMKRPEYAAIVTKVYSDLLREHRRPTAEERDILRRVFSRDGFTDGYYTGKLGDSMFGTKTDVPMNEVKKLYDEAAHRFAEGKEAPLVPVSLCFTARKDTGAVLSADGVSVVMPVEQAQNRPTTPEMIEKSLRKTGGTPFYIENMRIEVQDGLMIPASVMNGMRRDALDLLLAKRGVAPSRDWLHGSVLPRDDETAAREGFRGYTATVRTKAQADALRELGLETVYVPLEVAAQTGLPAILPRVFSDNEQPQIEMLLGEAMSRGTDTVLAGNIGHIPLAKRLGFTVHGDFGLNAYNSKTLSALAEMGVSRQTLSFEARLAQIRDMRGPLETDLIVYGRLPLMIFENCAIRRQHGGKCSCQNGVTYLTDRRRERFPLLNEFGCRNTLLNSRPLCLREDFARLGVQTARLQFTIESPEECVRIARAFLSGAPLDGEFTNGLYKRGVE